MGSINKVLKYSFVWMLAILLLSVSSYTYADNPEDLTHTHAINHCEDPAWEEEFQERFILSSHIDIGIGSKQHTHRNAFTRDENDDVVYSKSFHRQHNERTLCSQHPDPIHPDPDLPTVEPPTPEPSDKDFNENIIHNHPVHLCDGTTGGYILTNHGGEGGWHSHTNIIRGTAKNGIVYSDEYFRLHDEKTPCEHEPKPIPEEDISPVVPSGGDPNPASDGGVTAPVPASSIALKSQPLQRAAIPANVLRISYLSFDEVLGRGRINSDWVLTLQLTAYTPNTQHNFLVIRVNGYDYPTPNAFFGGSPLNTHDMREVSIAARPKNSAVYLRVKTPKNGAWILGGQSSWQPIERFDITNFTVSIRDIGSEIDRDSVTQDGFDADGNRIGSVLGAPSSHRMLTGLWADLKNK